MQRTFLHNSAKNYMERTKSFLSLKWHQTIILNLVRKDYGLS